MRKSRSLICTSLLVLLLSSCYGPRNIYSSGPYISPVKLDKNESAIEAFHYSNTKKSDLNDSAKGNKNNGYGLSLTHRFNSKNQFNYYAGIDNEKIILNNTNRRFFGNANFDYSTLFTKRYTTGIGFTQFANNKTKAISYSEMIGFQHTHIYDTGRMNQKYYERNFDINNLYFIIQTCTLFDLSKSLKIGIMERFTISHYFSMKSNYTSGELDSTGLNKANKTQLYVSIIGLHVEFKPLKKLPVFIICQWYNDWSFWNHLLSSAELNRTYIRGSGASIGLKYNFKSQKDIQ